MNGPRAQETGEEAFAEANAWFFRLQADDATAHDRQAFAAWLARGPAEQRAWREVEALVGAMGVAARPWVVPAPPPRRAGWGRVRAWAAAAAVAALLAVVSPPVLERLGADYVTATGEQRTITLADGSTVEINSATVLDTADRQVTLRRGEAFFTVTPDADHPFVVQAGEGVVRVVGTRFAVALRDGRAAVAVEEGVVDVAAAGSPSAPVRLRHGQGTSVEGAAVLPAHPVDLAAALAWRRGQIVFEQQPLSAVVAELNRYRPGRIIIVGDALSRRVVSGTFEIGRPESALDALRVLLGMGVTSVSPYLVVLH